MAPLLEVRGLAKCFVAGAGSCRASAAALRGVDLRVSAGEVVVLAGAPGAGKSTLLHCIAGVVRPDAGYVLWRGAERPRLGDGTATRVVLAGSGLRPLALGADRGLGCPTLLLLDHPLGALVARSRALQASVAALAARGVAVVLTVRAPHHAAALRSLQPRVVLLAGGRVAGAWRPRVARRAQVAQVAEGARGVGGRAGAH